MIYEVRCETCGKHIDIIRSVEDRNNIPECCGATMRRCYGGHNVVPDFQPYVDPNIAHEPTLVKSKQHRKRLLEEHGLTEAYGKGWR